MYKNILVTGAGGFIGKSVVLTLLQNGFSVLAMIRQNSISPFKKDPNLTILRADMLDYTSFSSQVSKIDAVVHLAANKYHPTLSYEVNVTGAHNLLRLLKEKKLKTNRLINISSQSTKIKWMGVYGKSKLESDKILENSSYRWTTLKPSLVYGNEKGTLFNTIAEYIQKLPFIPVIGNGKWTVYPLAVNDLADTIVNVLRNDQTIGKVYDVGCPQKVEFDEMIKLIQSQLQIEKRIIHIPFLPGLAMIYLLTKFIPTLPLSVDNVLGSNQYTRCDPIPAIDELKVKPMSVKDGLIKYFPDKDARHNNINIAIVGLGKMGILHGTILNTLPHVNITAIIDTNVQLINTVSSMGIKTTFFNSLIDALKEKRCDCVYICTPTFVHKEIINICLKEKIPYFVEKPTFNNFDDFKDILKNPITSKSGSGYFWIFKREVQYTKKLLEENKIGKILNYKVRLKHSEVFGPKKGWTFQKKLSGGGVLINPGPHAFSLIQYFFNDGKVTDAKLKYLYNNEVEDEAMVTLEHKDGFQGELHASWSVPNCPVLTIEYEIVGKLGKITYNNNALTVTKYGEKKAVLPIYDLPLNYPIFNLNPRSGGDAYYIEDYLFTKSLVEKTRIQNSVHFSHSVESLIHQAYEIASRKN